MALSKPGSGRTFVPARNGVRCAHTNSINTSKNPNKSTRFALLRAAFLATTCCFSPIIGASIVHAQFVNTQPINPDAEFLLKADKLIYDNDNEKVTALGNVQLDYDGYNVVANEVSYNQKTGKVSASGNVEIIDPSGNRTFADEIDLSDDFSQGFVNALRVETAQDTRFAAESAERFEDGKTVFNHGVYTACKACKENPEKPPLWQVKATEVILDGVNKTVTYRKARFELFGLPIAYLPYFSHATENVGRKTGFLTPSFGYGDELGAWVRQPYFWATGETHDLTVAATGFTKQGVLADVRWRHQLENGSYEIKAAGITQRDRGAFTSAPDNLKTDRGMISTKGRFEINPRWAFGWSALVQSDSNFSRTYKIKGQDDYNITNEIYLRGLGERSYFDLSAKQYLIQNSTLLGNGTAFQFESEQPLIRPTLDYNMVKTEQLTGGEVTFDLNATSLERSVLSTTTQSNGDVRTLGLLGDTTRVSADLTWRRTIQSSIGLMVTPMVSLRGDWTSVNGTTAAGGPQVTNGDYTRFMPTAGLEVSYPVLAQYADTSHVIEPVAQVYLRPDLGFEGVAPNEDAQSLVFDATTLFQRDKFSGYDRIESGHRANVGVRYSGQFGKRFSLNGVIGQSFHMGNNNPYARQDDLVNVGQESGLETDRSDIVASLSLSNNTRLTAGVLGRFDEATLDMRRGEALVNYSGEKVTATLNYTLIDAQPNYGFDRDRQQVGLSGSVRIADNWSLSGGVTYDIDAHKVVDNHVGLSYTDECFHLALTYSETHSRTTSEVSQSFGFKLAFRTFGEFENSGSVDGF